MLVAGLSPRDLANLRERGFARVATSRSGVTRLSLPAGPPAEAAAILKTIAPETRQSRNDYYYPAGHGEKCPDCDVRALIAWSETLKSCGGVQRIGVVDTAIDLDDPALAGQDIEILPIEGRNESSAPGHGTQIVRILVGRSAGGSAGLLPAAKIVAVDAFSRSSGEQRADAMSLILAIEKLVEHGVDVINLSLAGPPNAFLQQAIDSAVARGIVVVAAVGNSGPGGDPAYPAAYANVVAVTAVDEHLDPYRRANRGDYVDIAAPVDLAGTDGAPAEHPAGTSYAAPVVSAALAAMRGANRELTPQAAVALLKSAALDLGKPGRDPVFGWGLVQAGDLCRPEGDVPAVAAASPPEILNFSEEAAE